MIRFRSPARRTAPAQPSGGITRRKAVKAAMAAFTLLAGGARPVPADPIKAGRLLVPGYRSDEALAGGRLIVDLPGVRRAPSGWDGPLTLVSVLDLADPDSEPMRAAFPVRGHGIALAPAGLPALFVAMEGDTTVAFDPLTLELHAIGRPLVEGAAFGGHAAALPDGLHVLVAERPRLSARSPQEGWLSIRDATSLAPVGRIASHGLRPHDVHVTEDGRHAVVANYGSVPSDEPRPPEIPRVLAPCLCVIELDTGKLVQRIEGADATAELRHLVAPRLDRIFAVAAHLAGEAEAADRLAEQGMILASEPGLDPGTAFLPALPLRMVDGRAHQLMPDRLPLARHGLSIAWDAHADEVLVTFPAAEVVAVFRGADGALADLIPTAPLGLRHPSGLCLAADGRHWIVTGHEAGVLALTTKDHAVAWASGAPRWWGHSHIARL